MRRVEKEIEKKVSEKKYYEYLNKIDFLSHDKAREYRAKKIDKILSFLATASRFARHKKTIND